MLGWALTFLVIALIAAALGFGGIAGAAAGIAKIIFFIFLVLLIVSLVMHFVRGTAQPKSRTAEEHLPGVLLL